MRERKSLSSRRTPAAASRKPAVRPKHDYSTELMELAVEAANSRVLPEFLRGFAERAAEMLQASWAAVAEIVGNRVEVYSRNADFPANENDREWLSEALRQRRPGLESRPLQRSG